MYQIVTEAIAATIEYEAEMRSIKMVLTKKEFTIPATIEDKALTVVKKVENNAIVGNPRR